MKQLKNLISASILLGGLLLLPLFPVAQSMPLVKLFSPEVGHNGYLAPLVELCDPANPCASTSTIEVKINYDTIFDISSKIVHGYWFSPDGAAEVDLQVDTLQKQLKVTLRREHPVRGGGIILKLSGIGIVDPIPTKHSFGDSGADPRILQLSTFPNPCTDQCHFRFDRPIEHVALVSVQGEILWQARNLPPSELTLPMQGLPSGIYLLKLQSGQTTFTSKILLTAR